MTGEWVNLVNTFAFFAPPVPGLANSASVTHYQVSLVNQAPGGFGLSQLRHEAPRRFRVTGDGIDDGAFLILYSPNTADIASAPAPGQPPTTVPNAGANPFNFVLPLYAGQDAQGDEIWETAAEMEPLFLLSLLNGGPASAAAVTAFFDPFNPMFFNATGYVMTTTDLMQPTVNNWYFLQVVNFTAGGGIGIGTGGWQRLTIQ